MKRRVSSISGHNIGHDYTDEEIAWFRAIDAYKRDWRRPNPTWREVLALLKSEGYRKVAPVDYSIIKNLTV